MTIEDLLARDGCLVYKVRGTSMEPMLRQDRDLVVIRSSSLRLQKFDVTLYKRGGSYVLHRVIRVCEDHYLIRGDNTYNVEYVPDQAVLGVLTDFTRKGRQHSVTETGYRIYVHIWHAIYPFRRVLYQNQRLLAGFLRKATRKNDLCKMDRKIPGCTYL